MNRLTSRVVIATLLALFAHTALAHDDDFRPYKSLMLEPRIMDYRETRQATAGQPATRGANIADFRALFKAWKNEIVENVRILQRASPLSTTIQSGRQIY